MAERLVITVICDDPETVEAYREAHTDFVADDLLKPSWRAVSWVEAVEVQPAADAQGETA